jgi:hypothetical protein
MRQPAGQEAGCSRLERYTSSPPMAYFAIVLHTEDGPEMLDGYDTYEAADEHLDAYCDRYPNAYVDIHPVGR